MANKKRDIRIKAQASIFMIVAAAVLLLGILYFIYQRASIEREVEVVQPEISPVKQFVENCIKSAAEEGLDTIGLSGGYIKIPEVMSRNQRAYLTKYPGLGFKSPYWWHDGISAIPSEQFINQQLRSYVESELKACTNSFEQLKDQFDIKELKSPAAEVKFNDNNVYIKVNYLLDIRTKDGNFRASRENFDYTVPIRFRKVYELARLIMERENKDYFLEKRTIDLYSMDIDIPTTDMEARCSAKTWLLSDIQSKMKELLRFNLPYIRIKGTDYNPDLYVPSPDGKSAYSKSYYQQHYIWDIDDNAARKYSSMKVSFSYDDWPLSIYARPIQNGVLRSNAQKGSNMLSFFCLHIWHFTYDISYPVMATIIDQESKSSKEYRFTFPFRVSIDHNQPNRASKGTALFESAESSEEYCNEAQNEITIFTVNNATGEDIRGVNMTFVCGRFYCDVGQSDWVSLGAAAGITKKLPYCVNGIIKGSKEGFADAQSFVQTDSFRTYVLGLNPVKNIKNYKIVKHMISDPSTTLELDTGEKASILIRENSTGYEAWAYYPIDSSPDSYGLALPSGKDAVFEVTIFVGDEESISAGYIGEWKASKSEIENAEEVLFHVAAQGSASEEERALFIARLESYSKSIPGTEIRG